MGSNLGFVKTFAGASLKVKGKNITLFGTFLSSLTFTSTFPLLVSILTLSPASIPCFFNCLGLKCAVAIGSMLFKTFDGKTLMAAHSHAVVNGNYHRVPHLFEVDLSGDKLKVVAPYKP